MLMITSYRHRNLPQKAAKMSWHSDNVALKLPRDILEVNVRKVISDPLHAMLDIQILCENHITNITSSQQRRGPLWSPRFDIYKTYP